MFDNGCRKMEHLSDSEPLRSPTPIVIQPITDIAGNAPAVMKSDDFSTPAPDGMMYNPPNPVDGMMSDDKTAQNIVISDYFSIKPEHPHAVAFTQFEG